MSQVGRIPTPELKTIVFFVVEVLKRTVAVVEICYTLSRVTVQKIYLT